MASIPTLHQGIDYTELMADLSKKRSTREYLEIGVANGHLLSKIVAKHAIGVDPYFNITANIAAYKNRVSLYQTTSDDFFSSAKDLKLDFAFLDGLHNFEFLLRDFYNTEMRCTESSLIGMHDCLPLNSSMMERVQAQANAKSVGTPFANWYTGDVWKIVPILKKYRPELRIVCVDCAPTGIVFVSNLDPLSTILRQKYATIVDEYIGLGNDKGELAAFYQEIDIVSASNVMEELNHSLYFQV